MAPAFRNTAPIRWGRRVSTVGPWGRSPIAKWRPRWRWTGVRAWCLGAILYLPEEWLTLDARRRARIPAAVTFQEKWRHALTLLRQVRAAGFQLPGVVGDAEFGDVSAVRMALHRLRLPYALGISSDLTVFLQRPALRPRLRRHLGRPSTRVDLGHQRP